jgi:hypothetical protein
LRIKDPIKNKNDFKIINISRCIYLLKRRKILLTLLIGLLVFLSFQLLTYQTRKQILVEYILPLKHVVRKSTEFFVKTNFAETATNYFKSLNVTPENLYIDIEHIPSQNLAYQREMVIKHGRIALPNNQFQYVKGEIRHKNKTMEIGIRPKGDVVDDHMNEENWSFRVKIKGNNSLFGMKKMSFHRPISRQYIHEWIFMKALQAEKIISLRYKFVNVTLNGKDLGIYALEEHFNSELISANKHREGVIVKFDEDLMYQESSYQRTKESYVKSFRASSNDAFKISKIREKPELFQQFKIAISLLEQFKNKALKTSDVFDLDTMAKHAALSDIMGAHHGMNWHNRRFFYNPVTSRLEPIGFDADIYPELLPISYLYLNLPMWGDRMGFHMYSGQGSFNYLLWSDYVFFERYLHFLEKFSQPSYLENLFNTIHKELDKNLSIIHKDAPYYSYRSSLFYENQDYIRKLLYPTKGIRAYQNEFNKNRIQLEVGNLHNLPMELLYISYKGTIIPIKKTILKRIKLSEPIQYRILNFSIPDEIIKLTDDKNKIKVHYKILGTSKKREEFVIPWPRVNRDLVRQSLFQEKENFDQFDFLDVSLSKQKIWFKIGKWKLNKNLIIPAGFTLIAKEGVELDLLNSAKILSYSPLYFVGSMNSPVVVKSSDLTGQGIVVIGAGKKSKLENVIFKKLSAPKQSGWELPAAISFYESPVEISYVQFIDNHNSDDFLNIIRSKFKIEHSFFTNTFSDALDIDFSEGTILNSSFTACGKNDSNGDCLDLSGSKVHIQNILIDGASDKGLSVGEESTMTADQILIKNTRYAVVSKDLSELNINSIDIESSNTGFVVFKKKVQFGPASIVVKKYTLKDVQTPYLVEKKSTLILGEKMVVSKHKNIRDVLYPSE